VGPRTPLISIDRSHPIFRSVKKLSSDPKISRNTRKFIRRSITLSISTRRHSRFPTHFTSEIAANRQMTPSYHLDRSFSWVLSQTVMAPSRIPFPPSSQDCRRPFRRHTAYPFSGSDAPTGE
jgi:hypothetical protein